MRRKKGERKHRRKLVNKQILITHIALWEMKETNFNFGNVCIITASFTCLTKVICRSIPLMTASGGAFATYTSSLTQPICGLAFLEDYFRHACRNHRLGRQIATNSWFTQSALKTLLRLLCVILEF